MNTIDPSEAYRDESAIQTVIDGKRCAGFLVMLRPDSEYFIDLYDSVVKGGLKLISIGKNNAYIYYRKGCEKHAQKLAMIASKNDGYLPIETPEETREIGLLLGYNPEAVETFVNRHFPNLNESKTMKKKLIITENQYKLIQRVVTEGLLTEDMKEIGLCVRSIMKSAKNDNLSNYNKVRADKLISNPSVMTKIKQTIEDPNKLEDLVAEFEEFGMKNAHVTLAKDAHEIVDEFNKLTKLHKMEVRLDTDAINNLKELNN